MSPKYFGFDKARETGEHKEKHLQEILIEAGAIIIQGSCKDGSKDFSCNYKGRKRAVEVKCEDRYKRTGNICIEVSQGKPPRPSGIMVSHADICIHTRDDECVLYDRRSMKTIVEEWLKWEKPKIYGDNHNQNFIKNIATLRMLHISLMIYESTIVDLAYSRIWDM